MSESKNKLLNENLLINNENQNKIIILNLLKMISNRNLINSDNINSIFDKITKNNQKITNFDIDIIDNKKLYVYFINFKISSIKKIDYIDKILEDKNNKYVFIVNDIQNKIWETLIENEIEIFYRFELMINLIDHNIIPKHELLKNKDKENFINLNKSDLNKLPRIFKYDPISRYYNAQIGDIFRILRPSITSGYSIIYRIVVNGPLPEY